MISKQHSDLLRALVQQSYGKKLTRSFECELLSRDVKKVTGAYLSPQTLRRFFGFLKTAFISSAKTLDTLAVYTGFSNFHSFTEQVAAEAYQPLTLQQEAGLYLDFYKLEMKAEADMNYHNAARNIALRILFNPALLAKLAPALSKNPVSQIYFFERFPYIDGLGSDYKRSIRLYLQKQDAEAQIFGYSLFFLSAFLCQKDGEIKTHIGHINKQVLLEHMHPFTIARYIGSKILYEVHINGEVDLWVAEAHKWNKHFLAKEFRSFWHYPYYQHMITDYLNLAGLFDESCRIIRSVSHVNKKYEIERGYEEALEVISHIANHIKSPEGYVAWIGATSAFENMHPLFKKFYELQAQRVLLKILTKGKKKNKVIDRLNELIEQTAFIFFASDLSS